MAFVTWIMDPAHLAIILGVLLALSEGLALIPAVGANSVFQMILGFIKKAAAAVKPKV